MRRETRASCSSRLAATICLEMRTPTSLPPLFGEFGRVQRRAAKKYGVKLIPKRILMGVLSRREATSDSIHLTGNGQQAMARAVWRIVADGLD